MKNALSISICKTKSIKEYTSGVNQRIWLDIQGSTLSIKTTTAAVPIKLMSITPEKDIPSHQYYLKLIQVG